MRETKVAGFEAIVLASKLLQRANVAHPEAGLLTAADIQWSWRMPRRSDHVEQLFWFDGEEPVAAAFVTSWTDDIWLCNPIVVSGSPSPGLAKVWERGLQQLSTLAVKEIRVLIRDDDETLGQLVRQCGFVTGDQESTGWMKAADRPAALASPNGFSLVDRTARQKAPHPMRQRSGDGVAQRLAQCPLYDSALDISVETDDGQVAGYSLYWFDPVTRVGVIEPVRVENGFQRRGLARTMLCTGLERLAAKGAERFMVAYYDEPAAALYESVGFKKTSTATWFSKSVS